MSEVTADKIATSNTSINYRIKRLEEAVIRLVDWVRAIDMEPPNNRNIPDYLSCILDEINNEIDK